MIPVFLFIGFLESGKTSFINELFETGGLAMVPTLVIITEKGEKDLAVPERFRSVVTTIRISDQDEMSEGRFLQWQTETGARQVIIEYNGMWPLGKLGKSLPGKWMLYRTILTADTRTFMFYNQNMRALCADKLRACSMVWFSRLTPGEDTAVLRRLVRAINRKADIYYEYADGSAEKDESSDDLPYDLSEDLLIIENDAFAVWQLDMRSFPEKYSGKEVLVCMQVYPGNAVGRRVMTCCEADIETIQYLVIDEKSLLPEEGVWGKIRAKIEADGQNIRLKLLDAHCAEMPVPEPAVF